VPIGRSGATISIAGVSQMLRIGMRTSLRSGLGSPSSCRLVPFRPSKRDEDVFCMILLSGQSALTHVKGLVERAFAHLVFKTLSPPRLVGPAACCGFL